MHISSGRCVFNKLTDGGGFVIEITGGGGATGDTGFGSCLTSTTSVVDFDLSIAAAFCDFLFKACFEFLNMADISRIGGGLSSLIGGGASNLRSTFFNTTDGRSGFLTTIVVFGGVTRRNVTPKRTSIADFDLFICRDCPVFDADSMGLRSSSDDDDEPSCCGRGDWRSCGGDRSC